MSTTVDGLTLEEQACNSETQKHIRLVGRLINLFIKELLVRAERHDQSKLERPEVEYFAEFTEKLRHSTYDSPEYHAFREAMKPALDHHYASNRHHPEHFRSGIDDMNLVDLIEMFCDWKAASTRHDNGNIRKSIEKNATRFNMSPQLVRIFENSVDLLES